MSYEDNKGIVISLMDAAYVLKVYLRTNNNIPNYNCREYMLALINDMFNSDNQDLNNLSSTAILVQHDIPLENIKEIEKSIFITVVDTISSFMPDIVFSNKNPYSFVLNGEYDLIITKNIH